MKFLFLNFELSEKIEKTNLLHYVIKIKIHKFKQRSKKKNWREYHKVLMDKTEDSKQKE